MQEFIVPAEDRSGYYCPICNLKLTDLSLMVSHLALRPHWKARSQLMVLYCQSQRLLRCKLCHKQFDSHEEFWTHQVRDHFYDDLAIQVLSNHSGQTAEISCPVESCQFQDEKMSRVIDHLGVDHGKVRDLYQRLLVTESLTCQLCQTVTSSVEELKLHLTAKHFSNILMSGNHFYQLGNSFHCSLCDAQEEDRAAMLAHVGSVHNVTEELYRLEVEGLDIRCELCGWRSCKRDQFLAHITEHHCQDRLVARCGAEVYRCDVCSQYFPHRDLYLKHIGSEGVCNQALPLYFSLVDALHSPDQVTSLLPVDHAEARLDTFILTDNGVTTERTFFKSYLAQIFAPVNNYLDPRSCDIDFNYNLYTNTISIIFRGPVHPDNLYTSRRLMKRPFSCFLCDILGEPYEEDDLTSFQLHLAEHHFSAQLQLYFPVTQSGLYNCHLCRRQHLFSDLQSLTVHLASHHQIILGFYEACRPPVHPRLVCDNSPRSPALHQSLLSSLFPWFPAGYPSVTSLELSKGVGGASPAQCLECLEEFPNLTSLLDHMSHLDHVNSSWVAQTNDKGRTGR